MKQTGGILLVGGVVSIVIGFIRNNSIEAQLSNLFSSWSTNPGNISIVIGIAAILVGAILYFGGKGKQK